MTPAHRVFVLLGAYEDLTERETRALRRGAVEYAITLQSRKIRVAEAMRKARSNAELSSDDANAFVERVRSLETREKQNLETLREGMSQVRAALGQVRQAAHRTKGVRRGYGNRAKQGSGAAPSVLGRA